MSRLDSVIRRLEAQRKCLGAAAGEIANTDGVVFELGLGNGRTFDHLRELLPDREIFVFDRNVAAHPSCIPDDNHLFLGEFQQTLVDVSERFAGQCALVHADVGTGVEGSSRSMARFLSEILEPFLKNGAIVASDQMFNIAGCEALPLPAGVAPNRYFLLKKIR
ncbi:class I SAM-dependent methyltransferase [Motiliproteus sp. MSK22-1]|uniref:class I SAM-dependent methyltransferase n=1 Tax=Motiliproteus sp. MSK22-1 TaxID=1897630 RepID=UPI000977096F|nr:class I SAM-dependent methyltransferase [Motiliproteus sp. MSK22-1]OMH32671.1 hypothetical protein BGP75_14100 [Motiliproteus sp. MSK22-1]